MQVSTSACWLICQWPISGSSVTGSLLAHLSFLCGHLSLAHCWPSVSGSSVIPVFLTSIFCAREIIGILYNSFAEFLLVEDGCGAHSQTRTKFSKLLCCLVSIDVARVHSACVVSIAFLLPPAAEGGCHFFAILDARERTAASQRRGDRSKSSLPKIKAFISRAPSALSLPC